MIIVLFRFKLVANPEGYNAMSNEMDVLAKRMPGLIDVKSYTATDGERLTIVWWEDAETLKQWREQERHRVAQHQGRQQWYEYYKIEVAEVTRTSRFKRQA
jgi:heme-degrading monooxygenase HmoA